MKVLIMGHKIFSFDMLWGFLQTGCDAQIINPATAEQLDNIISDIDPDLLMTLGPPLEFKQIILEYIGKRNSAHMKYIHWDTDGISSKFYRSITGEGIEMDIINLAQPDMAFTMCPEMLELIRSKNIPCEMLQYAYSPMSHHPIERTIGEYKNFINIVGQPYVEFALKNRDHYRYKSVEILLKPLLENNYKINFYGDKGYQTLMKAFWNIDVPNEYFNRYLPYERTCEIYNSSYINLVTQNHEHTITKRTFEILGSGGFMISSDNKALRELFTPGRDLEVSLSPEQTLGLVEYYKNDSDAYEKIRNNASKSVENHTYKQRVEFILSKLITEK